MEEAATPPPVMHWAARSAAACYEPRQAVYYDRHCVIQYTILNASSLMLARASSARQARLNRDPGVLPDSHSRPTSRADCCLPDWAGLGKHIFSPSSRCKQSRSVTRAARPAIRWYTTSYAPPTAWQCTLPGKAAGGPQKQRAEHNAALLLNPRKLCGLTPFPGLGSRPAGAKRHA